MISKVPQVTDAGANLQIRALGGEKITFTRFKIGGGELSPEVSERKLTDLINPTAEFEITEFNTENEGFVKVTGRFDNTIITEDFKWSELGLFACGEDGEEVLYAYANDGENSGYLRAYSSSPDAIVAQTVSMIIAVGEAENVTAELSESLVYVSKEEFENHEKATNPHKTTAEDVGALPLYTSLTQIGLTVGSETIVSIAGALPSDSELICSTTSTSADIYPSNKNGTLRVTKKDMSRVKFEWTDNDTGNVFVGSYCSSNSTPWTGWNNLNEPNAHNHSASDITSGILAVARGGSGKSSWLANRLIYPSSSTSLNQLNFPSVAGSVLRQGTSGVPYWTSLADLAAAMRMCKVKAGTYIGTGTYYDTISTYKRCKISCDFTPKLVLVCQNESDFATNGNIHISPMIYGCKNAFCFSFINMHIDNMALNSVVWGSDYVAWYCKKDAEHQLNISGKTYNYIVFGT